MSQAPKDIQQGAPGVEGAMQGLAGNLNSILATVGIGFGISRIMSEARQAVGLASRQIDAEARVAAVIRTTGGAAGFTAGEMKKMASAFQEATRTGDEAILEVQAKFLTFKNIQGEVFEKGIELTLDMAAVMGTDARSSAIQMAMALEDPIRGVTRLRRAGVTFTDQQREQIKVLVEQNKLQEAQALVLGVIEGQIGGVAKAMAETDPGKLEQMSNTIGDIKEEIGKKLMPTMLKFKEFSLEMWEKILVGIEVVHGAYQEVAIVADYLFGWAKDFTPLMSLLAKAFLVAAAAVSIALAVLKAFAVVSAFVISLTGVGIKLVAAAAVAAVATMVGLEIASAKAAEGAQSLGTAANQASRGYKAIGDEAEDARKKASALEKLRFEGDDRLSRSEREEVVAGAGIDSEERERLQDELHQKSLAQLDEEIERRKAAEQQVAPLEERLALLKRAREEATALVEWEREYGGEVNEAEKYLLKREEITEEQEALEERLVELKAQEVHDADLLIAAENRRKELTKEIADYEEERARKKDLAAISDIDSLDSLNQMVKSQKEYAEEIMRSHGPNSKRYQQEKELLGVLEDRQNVVAEDIKAGEKQIQQAQFELRAIQEGWDQATIATNRFRNALGEVGEEAERLADQMADIQEALQLEQMAKRWQDAIKTPSDQLEAEIAEVQKLIAMDMMPPEMFEQIIEHLRKKYIGEEAEDGPLMGAGQVGFAQFGQSIQAALLQKQDPVEEAVKVQTTVLGNKLDALVAVGKGNIGGLQSGDN